MKKLLWLLMLLPTLVWADCDTSFLESDKWDAYTRGISEDTNETEVLGGNNITGSFDGYWAFLISEVIYSNTIDSVKISFRIFLESMEEGEEFKFYGIQQEDCDTIENQNLSGATRTTANVTQPAWQSTGQHISVNIDTIFNEWVDDYSHSGSDHFGLVLDDNGLSYDRIEAYDYSNGMYSNYTYLIIWHQSVEEEEKKKVITHRRYF